MRALHPETGDDFLTLQ